MRIPLKPLAFAALLALLAGCDQLGELLELPNPAQAEAEGRAVGGACRHAGRSLEDCYILNPEAPKASVFAGWREMNDYMMEHNIESVPSLLPHLPPPAKGSEVATPAPAAAPTAAPALP